MSDSSRRQNVPAGAGSDDRSTNWGPVLFLATLAAILVFFWWLLIYSGGVDFHHG